MIDIALVAGALAFNIFSMIAHRYSVLPEQTGLLVVGNLIIMLLVAAHVASQVQ